MWSGVDAEILDTRYSVSTAQCGARSNSAPPPPITINAVDDGGGVKMPSVEICEVTSSPVFGATVVTVGVRQRAVGEGEARDGREVRDPEPAGHKWHDAPRRSRLPAEAAERVSRRHARRCRPRRRASLDDNVVTVDATCGCDVDGVRSLIRPRSPNASSPGATRAPASKRPVSGGDARRGGRGTHREPADGSDVAAFSLRERGGREGQDTEKENCEFHRSSERALASAGGRAYQVPHGSAAAAGKCARPIVLIVAILIACG